MLQLILPEKVSSKDRNLFMNPSAGKNFETEYSPFDESHQPEVIMVELDGAKYLVLELGEYRSTLNYDGESANYLRPPKIEKDEEHPEQ